MAARADLGVPRVESPDRAAHPRRARRHPGRAAAHRRRLRRPHGHSIPLAHQIQRINERDLTSRVYSGSTAHGQSFLHMDDLVDAIERVVERRAELPPEVPLLLGEPEALSYDELQHTIARLIRGASKETIEIPGALAPLAKAGAWVLDHVPGQESFIKPWMIDRANDHYALDITRARTLLGWEPKRSLRETLPKDGRGAEGRSARLVPRERAGASVRAREDGRKVRGACRGVAAEAASRVAEGARPRVTRGERHREPRAHTRRPRRRTRTIRPDAAWRRDAAARGHGGGFRTRRWRWRTVAGQSGRTLPT